MFGLVLNPIMLRIAAVGGVILFLAGAVYMIEKRAADRALQAVERANRAVEKRADEAEQNVLTCPPELWSRELRRCATKLH